MQYVTRAALALLGFLAVAAPSFAATPEDGIQANLSWHLGFGAGSLRPGYALALGFRSSNAVAPLSRLLELNASDATASLQFAGLPLVARSYRADDTGGASNPAAASVAPAATVEKPWYAHGWVLWTAGGLAATAALAGGGGSVHIGSDENNQQTGPNCVEVGGNVNAGDTQVPAKQCANPGGQPVACTNGLCAFCGNNVLSNCPDGWAERIVGASLLGLIERNDWLDAGTGGMGDLEPR